MPHSWSPFTNKKAAPQTAAPLPRLVDAAAALRSAPCSLAPTCDRSGLLWLRPQSTNLFGRNTNYILLRPSPPEKGASHGNQHDSPRVPRPGRRKHSGGGLRREEGDVQGYG